MQNTDETPQTVTLAVVGDGNRIKPYEELTLMDDFMFGKIMSDKENCRKLLEIILHIDPATEIADPISQNSFRVSPGAKSIIVDIRTSDALNDYDIEAQKQNHPDLPKRARYYQAMMDIDFECAHGGALKSQDSSSSAVEFRFDMDGKSKLSVPKRGGV